MSEFSTEELFEAIDRAVLVLFNRVGTDPAEPIDALAILQTAFRYTITYLSEEDEEPRYGSRPKPKPRPRELQLREAMSDEAQQAAAAKMVARELIPGVFQTLGIVPGTEQRSAVNQLVGLVVPRLLLPTRRFDVACRKASGDLFRLKELFPTADYLLLATRQLDFEEPCVIAVVDDGTVALRRSNCTQVNKKLTAAEQLCVDKVTAEEEPQVVRRDDWTARGWPIPSGPFRRIILRSVPDGL
jgi:hypothetical protein